MRRELPAMAAFAELVRVAARTASAGVVERSRHNARSALEARDEAVRHGHEVLAALPAQASGRDRRPGTGRRRSA